MSPQSKESLRVFVQTMGCKLNQYDSEMILTQFRSNGYVESSSVRDADLIVINTCAVTEIAERKGRAAVRAALRSNQRAQVIATGCMAERAPNELLLAGAQKILGNREKESLFGHLGNSEPVNVGGVNDNAAWSDGTVVRGLQGRVRAFLKVQDGCSQFCTYCIIPALRGKGRSLSIDDAVERTRELVDFGVKEIVLTGVALGTYGFDTGSEDRLPDLIAAISAVPGLTRLRLGSVEPWAVSERFLSVVAESDVVCPHLHLPFQTGTDQLLRRMNRRYSVSHLKWIFDRAFKLRDDWGIGADVIVGFPGETEALYRETKAFLAEHPVSYLHVFPYSVRPGTPAAKLADKVSDEEVSVRAGELRELSRQLRSAFHLRHVGSLVEVIVENRGNNSHLYGHARNYSDVAVPRTMAKPGDLLALTVDSADQDFVYCN